MTDDDRPGELPKLLTPEEMADRLHVSVGTLRRWVTEGRVPYRRVGRKTRFSEDDYRGILDITARPPSQEIPTAEGRFAPRIVGPDN